MGKQKVFKVFYRDYANQVAISSTSAESLLGERIAPLAERLLVSEDNFLGVVDRNEVILQLYLDGEQVVMELLRPNTPGCLRVSHSLQVALAMLAGLPDAFDEDLLPGAESIDGPVT